VFGTGGYPLGLGPGEYGISQTPDWPYADYFAMDYSYGTQNSYSLSDFFNFSPTSAHGFQGIQGAKYPPNCFHDPTSCFSTYPIDPDDDGVESN